MPLLYTPHTAAEFFGTAALFLHLIGYSWYGWLVFQEFIRPHVLTWFMWLCGGIVEYATYQAIPGAHWSTNALPLACVLGLGGITFAILVAQVRAWTHAVNYDYEPLTGKDALMFGFDAAAGMLWVTKLTSAATANIIAVGTSVFTFLPIWRTTYHKPDNEHYGPWAVWTAAYMAMFAAVFTGQGAGEWGLYVYPILYFIFHAIVVVLCIRQPQMANEKRI